MKTRDQDQKIHVTYTIEGEKDFRDGVVNINKMYLDALEGTYEFEACIDIIISAIEEKYDCEVRTLGKRIQRL